MATVVTLTLSGTAGESDYTASTLTSVTIPAGRSSGAGSLTITPTDDGIVEDPESILITGRAAGMGESSATITLADANDEEGEVSKAYLGIASPSAEIPEGANAEFTVTLSRSVASDVTVAWSATPGTAESADYTAKPGAVTFAANSAAGATQTITVATNQDMLSEGAETFTVTLGTVSGGLASRVLVDPDSGSASATIAESDPITIELSGPSSVNEGDAGAYTVSLSPSGVRPTADLTVSYATSNGTALAGRDYTAKSGSVTFTPAAAGARTFTVQTTEDTIEEGSGKTFSVAVANPQGGGGPAPSIGSGSVATTITDDDARSESPDHTSTPDRTPAPTPGSTPDPTPAPTPESSSASAPDPTPAPTPESPSASAHDPTPAPTPETGIKSRTSSEMYPGYAVGSGIQACVGDAGRCNSRSVAHPNARGDGLLPAFYDRGVCRVVDDPVVVALTVALVALAVDSGADSANDNGSEKTYEARSTAKRKLDPTLIAPLGPENSVASALGEKFTASSPGWKHTCCYTKAK